MRIQDEVILALTVWRENRGGGVPGMHSVANVVMNRAAKHRTSAYVECVQPAQFSSLTAKGDPELGLWPADNDAMWAEALEIAAQAAAGVLPDLTRGADMYYAPRGLTGETQSYTLPNGTVVPFPAGWNENALVYTSTIAGQLFFK